MQGLLLAILIFLSYGNSLHNELVFDELMFVDRDPRVHELAVDRIFLEALWSEGEKDHRIHQYYRPLQLLPLAVSYRFFGRAAWPSHLVNLLVHLGNCLLVLGIFRVLLGKEQEPLGQRTPSVVPAEGTWPLVATALFAVHPGYSEAVLWVSDIAGLGAAFCILASVRLHLSPRRERWYGWIAAPLLLLCGLWFKESGVLAVALVVLYDLVGAPDRGLGRAWRMRWRYLVFLPPLAIYFAMRVNALGGALPGMQTVPLTRSEMWINAVALLPEFVKTFAWPFSLNMYHDFEAVHGVANLSFWCGAAILVTAGIAAVTTFRSHRVVAFGTLWALTAAAPHLLVRWPQLNVFAERYLYLPSAGIFLVVGYLGALAVARRREGEVRRLRFAPALVLVSMLGIFVAVDRRRTRDWHDEESIYAKTLTQSNRAELIRTNLAVRYLDEKRYDEGIAVLEPLLSINPDWHETRHNLGLLYMAKGDTKKAIAFFEEARRRDPFKGATLLNLGYLYDREGRREEAVMRYLELARREPDNAAAWYNLAVVATEERQLGNARFAAEQVLNASPQDREAQTLLRRIEALGSSSKSDRATTRRRCGEAKRLLDAERGGEAILTLEMAAWLDESSPLPHHYLSNIYYLNGHLKKALEEKQAALDRAPNSELYKRNVAALQRALAERGKSRIPDRQIPNESQ